MVQNISELIGKTLVEIKISEGKDEMIFICDDGAKYRMFHHQDCCETVELDDINGDLEDLIGESIVLAEESTNSDEPKDSRLVESSTWTFYKIATVKGYVDIKWYGESNGYYSEEVDFEKIE